MPPDRLDAVFFALADGTRRSVVRRLLDRETITATQLAGDLPISRQAVAKHLAALTEAGLVERRREGRETRYELTPAPLGEAAEWLEAVGEEWDGRLDRLRRHVGGGPTETRS